MRGTLHSKRAYIFPIKSSSPIYHGCRLPIRGTVVSRLTLLHRRCKQGTTHKQLDAAGVEAKGSLNAVVLSPGSHHVPR
jgi:hypothetical protein